MNHPTGDGACEDALSFAIERLAAPWPQRTRNKEHMPKEGRRIKEDHQQGEKVRVLLLLPVDLCCVIIIILVQRLSKSKNIPSSLVVFIYSLQGYSNREESRRNKEPFGMRKEGRRIKEDNQQGGKVRSTVVVLG